MIYLDNAATTWPKPPGVLEAMTEFLNNVGANPGRSAHRLSVNSGRIVYTARETLAEFLGLSDPLRIAFTMNATEALNVALFGLLSPGDHVITSCMEHNSVMRPLRALEREGVEVTVLPGAPDGLITPGAITENIRPNTALVAINHASNVTGTLQPIAEIGQITRKSDIYFLIDASQTAGAFPIDMNRDCIDLLAFTGHKSLLGPMGTGGLACGERVDVKNMRPLKRGGTGSNSEHEEQPDFLPDAFESGTPNVMGLAGLNAGVNWIMERGVEAIRSHEESLVQLMIDGLSDIHGVTLYGPGSAPFQTGIVSFGVAGISPSEAAMFFDEEYEIMCRAGLHCAPGAHRHIGTFPSGTVRFSLSAFNTEAEVETAIRAVAHLRDKR